LPRPCARIAANKTCPIIKGMSVLPTWDPNRLIARKPFVAALVGGRKQGKSTAQQDLLHRMANEFDLVLAFVGSAACNPFLEHLLTEHWDPRFFFPEWDEHLIGKLLLQQEELMKAGIPRRVLILCDDVILNSSADDQLAHMAMRGRHFSISLMMCAVSYTSLPKRMRRSLDVLLVYSIPMRGDMLVLTQEYCQGNNNVARFMLNNLRDHEALVLETLTKRQQLYTWKADLLTLRDKAVLRQTDSTPALSVPESPETPARGVSELGRLSPARQSSTSVPQDCSESEEPQ